jgi:hypothetical protein
MLTHALQGDNYVDLDLWQNHDVEYCFGQITSINIANTTKYPCHKKNLLITKKADLNLRSIIYNDLFVFVGFSNHCLLNYLACKMDTNNELMKSSCYGTGGGQGILN